MSTQDNLNDAAIEVALGVKSASGDGHQVEAQTVDEIKKAAQFVASNVAATKPHFGLRFTKLVPPGCG